MLRLMRGHAVPSGALARLADSFAERETGYNIREDARAAIVADRDAGYRIVIATAAPLFYAMVIARRIGVADVIATRNETDASGHVLYRIAGPNCYGEAKAAAIESWLGAVAPEGNKPVVRFYSDAVSDLPTFAAVDEPIVVNPGRALRTIAVARGFRIVRWR